MFYLLSKYILDILEAELTELSILEQKIVVAL